MSEMQMLKIYIYYKRDEVEITNALELSLYENLLRTEANKEIAKVIFEKTKNNAFLRRLFTEVISEAIQEVKTK